MYKKVELPQARIEEEDEEEEEEEEGAADEEDKEAEPAAGVTFTCWGLFT